ncbi:hypothetical protein [Actinomadura graeca]|uniref:hypothetical protein n=1 Tax=Actinomadura graeca TaxID=2750812 RepID=UPI003B839767
MDQQARAEDLPHLHAFTRGLDLVRDAVNAALTLPFHNVGTEGVNTKTQMIKRQMYGRAPSRSFDTGSCSADTTVRHH